MRYPLLWKELRESKYATWVGLLWMLAPIQFWLDWKHIDAPWPVDFILVPSAMFASGVCMLMLSVARFAYERHTGTWEFLLTRPVNLRRAVATKFAAALSLTVLFMSLSAALSWYPITRLETRLAHIPLVQWTCFHAAAASLFVSILLMVDTFNWGEWLGMRAIVTAALLVPFFWLVRQSFNDHAWAIMLYAALAAGCAVASLVAAPWVTRESSLPFCRPCGVRLQRQFASQRRALVWMQWRQIRTFSLLLLAPVPLFITVICVPGLLEAQNFPERMQAIGRMLPIVDQAMPALLCIAGGLLGLIIPIMENQCSAESFRISLPLERSRLQHFRVAFVLGMLAILSIPVLLVGVSRVMIFEHVGWLTFTGRFLLVLGAAAAASILTLVVSTVTIAFRMGILMPIFGLGGIMLSVYLCSMALDNKTAGSLPVVIGTAIVLSLGMMLLPLVEKHREI